MKYEDEMRFSFPHSVYIEDKDTTE